MNFFPFFFQRAKGLMASAREFASPKRIVREGTTRASLPAMPFKPDYVYKRSAMLRASKYRTFGPSGNAHDRRIQRRAAFRAVRNKLTAA